LHFFPTRNHRRKPTQDGRDVLLVMFDLEAPFQGKSTARSLEAVIVSCTIINWLPEKSCSCFIFCFHVILWRYIMLYIYNVMHTYIYMCVCVPREPWSYEFVGHELKPRLFPPAWWIPQVFLKNLGPGFSRNTF
jgi:hypothetical protein